MFKFFPKLSPLKSQSDELLHIDLLRFVAAYAIVLFHFAQCARGSLAEVMAHFSHFHLVVDLFLIISGFIISFVYENRLQTRSDYAIFLWRRIARLAPLHWATMMFFVGLGLLVAAGKFHTSNVTNYDWNCLIPNAAALQAFGICKGLTFNFVNWSISAEMGMYIITPALLWIGRKSRYAPLLLSAGAILLLSTVFSVPNRPWYDRTWDFGVIRAFPDFAMGVALFFFRSEIARIPFARLLLLITLAGFVIGSLLDWPDAILLFMVYLTAVAGVACDMKGQRRDRISALGVYGQLMYSMYMLHPVIMIVLMAVVGQHILHLGATMMNYWLLLVVFLVAPISYLSLELFETPARRWIAGSKRRSIANARPNPFLPPALVGDRAAAVVGETP